ncbi:hypothetical protein [Variovorax boronicumulans]|uniref:hypothetical protein n=1 Tax=Variovorax boronicumulans TaxID=436515 RepID=UPI0027D8708A|nr:hypothetical protein [Variovorax boronicumulans]
MEKLFIARRVLGEGAMGYVEEIHPDKPVDERYEFVGDESVAMKLTLAQCQQFGNDVGAMGSVAFSLDLASPNQQWTEITATASQA